MSKSELLERFQQRLRYKQAKSWQKPWLDPGRFAKNQVRKRTSAKARLGKLWVVSTFHCAEFTVVSGERVSETIGSYGVYEESLTDAFLRLVEPNQVVVDIGMHLGYYTTLFACLVGPSGAVHAFEPTPSTREIAQRNVGQYPQVSVHPEALWSSVEKLRFRDYGVEWMAFNSFGSGKGGEGMPTAKEFDVQTTTLDVFREELRRKVALVKIDAESAEAAILSGGRRMLESDRPIVTMEVGDVEGQPSSRQAVDLLCSMGYRAWEIRPTGFVLHQPKASYDYDNLIFAPKERELR